MKKSGQKCQRIKWEALADGHNPAICLNPQITGSKSY